MLLALRDFALRPASGHVWEQRLNACIMQHLPSYAVTGCTSFRMGTTRLCLRVKKVATQKPMLVLHGVQSA